MRMTLIKDDGLIIIDGRALTVDLSDMPEGLHAVQWYGEHGEVERQGLMNQPINSLSDFQTWISRWNEAAAAEDSAPVVVPVVSSCTRRQGRLALLNAGKLSTVESIISGITDPVEKQKSVIEYEAETWERSNLFLQTMWANLGGTPEELDALFSEAVTL